MIELVKSPSMQVLSKACLALWLVVLLVFATLLFAVDAQAQGMSAAETPVGETAAKGGAPPEEASSVVEQAPPGTPETPSAVEQTSPAAEETPPTTEQAPPVAQEAPPVIEQTPPVAEQAPPVIKQTPPVAEETPLVTEKKPVEQVATEGGSEATPRSGENSGVRRRFGTDSQRHDGRSRAGNLDCRDDCCLPRHRA